MKLNSIINEDLVFCDIKGNCREDIYALMLEKAEEYIDESLDIKQLLSEIIEREDSIGMPYEGVALPHVRNSEINDLYIIIGILEEPVKLKSNDISSSRVVVMSLISNETSDVYLKSLAAFARFFSKPANIEKCAELTSAEDLFVLLHEVKLKEHITAEDIMENEFPVVKADDLLGKALDIMYKHKINALPVVGSDNRLIGKIDATEVLKAYVPEYLFMMDSLKFVSSFEMFDKFFKDEVVRKVSDLMIPADSCIAPETPLIQFTVTLAKRDSDMIFVVDAEKKLHGVISINSIIHKILRG